MILIDNKDYYKLLEPLKAVTINNLFARAVAENRVKGRIYVDKAYSPKTFYIVHPYGMSLLFGNSNNTEFNQKFKEYSLNLNHDRDKYEWMQAFPDNWDVVLNDLYKEHLIKSCDNPENKEENRIELNTRVNFRFNKEKYLDQKQAIHDLDIKIVRTDKQLFEEMKGSVVPYYFWNNADDFYKYGMGFSLFYKNQLASTAYSAFVHDNKLELGIETVDEFRGKGFAQYACSALIDYCLQENYEPIWACKLENTGSYKLAHKVGFEPALKIPYYRLCK